MPLIQNNAAHSIVGGQTHLPLFKEDHNSTMVLQGDTPKENKGMIYVLEQLAKGHIVIPVWGLIAMCVAFVVIMVTYIFLICKTYMKSSKKHKKNSGTHKQPLLSNYNGFNKDGTKKEGMKEGLLAQFDSDDEMIQSADELFSSMYYGKLKFSLEYNFIEQSLGVDILQGIDVPAANGESQSDCFVKVFLLPDEQNHYSTQVIEKSFNPCFSEHFSFPIGYADAASCILVMQMFAHDRSYKDSMLGQLEIPLHTINLQLIHDLTMNLREPLQEKVTIPLGEICLTLHYSPLAGRLTVIILECKKLKNMTDSNDELSNPYIKIDLYSDKKRLRKKKTSYRENTLNPYFNTPFSFDVPVELIGSVTLVVTVFHHTPGMGKKNTVIGQMVTSADVSGSPYRQWMKMLRNPRKSVAEWHHLQPPRN